MCKNETVKSIIISLIFCAAVQAQQPYQAAKFVTIGHAGNAADTTGRGAVDHPYWISKTAVTVAEWIPFYNNFNTVGGIGTLSANYARVATDSGLSDTEAPVYYTSTADAAMYCNWLTTGSATHGVYTIGENGSGTLTIMGIDRDFRNSDNIAYVLPTENEWYKAAFYNVASSTYYDFSNGSDTAPTPDKANGYWYGSTTGIYDIYPDNRAVDAGAVEQNGTYNMMGIGWEWTEIGAGNNNGLGRGGRVSATTPLPVNVRWTSRPANDQVGTFRVVVIGNPARLSLYIVH